MTLSTNFWRDRILQHSSTLPARMTSLRIVVFPHHKLCSLLPAALIQLNTTFFVMTMTLSLWNRLRVHRPVIPFRVGLPTHNLGSFIDPRPIQTSQYGNTLWGQSLTLNPVMNFQSPNDVPLPTHDPRLPHTFQKELQLMTYGNTRNRELMSVGDPILLWNYNLLATRPVSRRMRWVHTTAHAQGIQCLLRRSMDSPINSLWSGRQFLEIEKEKRLRLDLPSKTKPLGIKMQHLAWQRNSLSGSIRRIPMIELT